MPERTCIDIHLEQELAEELEHRAGAVYLPVGSFIELVLMEQLHGEGQPVLSEE